MDPVSLAAVGLAGNIVQFVDFGCKVISKAREIQRDGFVVDQKHLQEVTEDMGRYTENLRNRLNAQQLHSDDEAAVRDLCSGCLQIGSQLEAALRELQLPGKVTRWKSIRQALKSIWGKDRLNALKDQLELYSQQLDRRMLGAILAKVDTVSIQQIRQQEDLDKGVQAAIDRMDLIEQSLRCNAENLAEADNKIVTAVEDANTLNRQGHIETQHLVNQMTVKLEASSSEARDKVEVDIVQLGASVANTIDHASMVNRQLHMTTRTEIQGIREEAQKQVDLLREEIRLLKIDIEATVRQAVTSVGKVSVKEERRLKEASNAKFNLWVAKELILKKLLEVLGFLKSQVGDWVHSFEETSWKISAYPQFKRSAKTPTIELVPYMHPESMNESTFAPKPTEAIMEENIEDEYIYSAIDTNEMKDLEELLKSRDINLPLRLKDNKARIYSLPIISCSLQSLRGANENMLGLLLSLGAKPTNECFQAALALNSEQIIRMVGDAFIKVCLEIEPPPLPYDLQARAKALRKAILKEDSQAVCHYLHNDSSLEVTPIDGISPLSFAVKNEKIISTGLLLLREAVFIHLVGDMNSPLSQAISNRRLDMVELLLIWKEKFVAPGWEWDALQLLSTSDFKAPGHFIDRLIDKIGIPLGLRLAIEHRHERLIGYMLWQFSTRYRPGSDDMVAGKILEQAWESGVERGYVERISDRNGYGPHILQQDHNKLSVDIIWQPETSSPLVVSLLD